MLFVVSLAAFNSCSLCLIFVNLINMCLGVFRLGFILFGTLGFLDLGGYFLPLKLGKLYVFLKFFSVTGYCRRLNVALCAMQ